MNELAWLLYMLDAIFTLFVCFYLETTILFKNTLSYLGGWQESHELDKSKTLW